MHHPLVTIQRLISEGLHLQALTFYAQHIHPLQLIIDTSFLVPSIAKACTLPQTPPIFGLQLHSNLLKNGLPSDSAVSNSLLSMYAKLSETQNARKVFDEMPERDTVSWNSIVNCYTQNGFLSEALTTFRDMCSHGFIPKPELIASFLKTCIETENWRLGRAMHGRVFLDGRIECTTFISTSLLSFYWRFGDLDAVFCVFDRILVKNEVSWTSMICGCIEHCDYVKAVAYIRAMQTEGVKPNLVTLISILPVCVMIRSKPHGREIHGYGIRHGYDSDVRFASSLIHMYCECGGKGLQTAETVFNRLPTKEIVAWSCMISGYSRTKDRAREGIRLFNEMKMEGIEPNDITLLALISACTELSSLSDGCAVHSYSFKSGLNSQLFVQNALINMYSKCGNPQDSAKVFDEMLIKDHVSWSALISAYGINGHAEEALHVYYEMRGSGIKADGVIYLAVLSACNHGGLVHEGKLIFAEAFKDSRVCLREEHYACYVDLLGRAGEIEDACDVVCGMPVEPSSRVLTSLVSACKLHGRLDVAGDLARELVRNEPDNAGNYTLLSMVCGECDDWDGVEEVRRCMKERKLRKSCSFSQI